MISDGRGPVWLWTGFQRLNRQSTSCGRLRHRGSRFLSYLKKETQLAFRPSVKLQYQSDRHPRHRKHCKMWPLVHVLIFITIYITLRILWKSLFRQKPGPQPLSLSTLASSNSLVLRQPRDIILSIADHLPLESIAALSLTNKDLWLLLNGDARLRELSNEASAKEEFLQLIERELGHKYYYCHECTRLHLFKGDWALSRLEDDGGRKYQSLGPCFRKYGANMTMASIHFPYPLARLVMNRHLHGPTHGLPLSALECEVRRFFRTSTPAVEWKVTWTARIWNNMLYMHSTHKLTHVREPYDPKDLRKAVDGLRHRLCSHLQTHSGVDRHGRELRLKDRLWTVARHTDGTFVPCNISGWCAECITDWSTLR